MEEKSLRRRRHEGGEMICKLASQGHAEAQWKAVCVTLYSDLDVDVPTTLEMLYRWTEAHARRGHAEAQFRAATNAENDSAEEFEWLLKASAQDAYLNIFGSVMYCRRLICYNNLIKNN